MDQNKINNSQGSPAQQPQGSGQPQQPAAAPIQQTVQNAPSDAGAQPAQPQQKKRIKKPLIIAIVAALVCSGTGGFFLYRHFADDDSGSGRRKGSKKDDNSLEELMDLTDYDADTEEQTTENIYVDGPEESEMSQLSLGFDDNGGFQVLSGSFDTKISEEYEALEFIDSYAEQIGIEDAYDELSYISENTIDDCTYYKFQQVYDDVPVYGNELIVSVNKDGIVDSVSGGYTPVDIDTDPSIDQEEAEEIVSKHLGGEAKIIENELCILPDSELYSESLAYAIRAIGDEKAAELLIDANSGEIIDENPLYSSLVEGMDVEIDGSVYHVELEKRELVGYNLYDPNRNITVTDADSASFSTAMVTNVLFGGFEPLAAIKVPGGENGNVKLYVYPKLDYTELIEPLGVPGIIELPDPMLPDYTVGSMSSIQNAYDYYDNKFGWKSIDGQGKALNIIVGVNDTLFHETYEETDKTIIDLYHFIKLLIPSWREYHNACYVGGTDLFMISELGGQALVGKGTLGHEYTHGVMDNVAHLKSNVYAKTVDEGYADVMGSLISGDWEFLVNEVSKKWAGYDTNVRSAIDPNKYHAPAILGDSKFDASWSDEHNNPTIISHTAYLMNQKGLSEDKIGEVFFHSMFRLTSNPDFEKAAIAVIKTAHVLGYSQEEQQAVAKSFIETKMLDPSGKVSVNVHCGKHIVPYATITVNGKEVGTTDEEGNLTFDFDPEWAGGAELSAEADGFKKLDNIIYFMLDDESIDINLAVADDFGSAHGSDAPISDGSTGEKVKVTIVQMAADGTSEHSKQKAQDYYVQKGSRISLKKLVEELNKAMSKLKGSKLDEIMDINITTDGNKIYFDTGYMPVEMSYVIYGTDEEFDFSKPVMEDVVIEPRVGVNFSGLGFGDESFNMDDMQDLADALDGMFNGGGKN
jgi:Zn-dependent metalloprotease